VCGSEHITSGIISADGKLPWPRTRESLLPHLQRLIEEHCPELVAIERTEMSGRADDGKSPQAVFSMGLNTQRTEELAGRIMALAVRHGAETVRVHPQTGLGALGLKRGAKDGQVAQMFTALTGIKLRATEAHQARALGVALAGASRSRVLPGMEATA
jgi:Holliday junction resolvasome RuvABC endonuclease subunit